MSLQVWLPLTKDLRQQGLSNTIVGNTGATYSSTGGKLGGCYIFDGVDDSLTIGNLSTLVDSEYSFACWFYHDETWSSKNYETIFGGPSGFELEAKNSSTNSPVLRLYSWGGSTCVYELNKWNHVVFTRNTTETKLYLNGELKLTGTAGTIPSGNYFIGSWSSTTSQNYKGKMCDVRIYDHCLSPMEVKELAKGLVLHYPFADACVEDTTNLNTKVNMNTSTNSVWGGHSTTTTIYDCTNEPVPFNSGNKIEITYPVGGNTGGGTSVNLGVNIPVSSSTTYTLSAYLKASDNFNYWTANFLYYYGDTAGHGIFNINNKEYIADGWYRIWGTLTTGSSQTKLNPYFYSYPSGNRTYYIGGWQLEQKNHMTPFVSPGGSRNNSIIYDCSGFCNNGTRTGTFSWSSDTPKYAVSTYMPKAALITHPRPVFGGTDQEWSCAMWVKLDTTNQSGIAMNNFNLNNNIVHSANSYPLLYLNGGTNDYYNYGNKAVVAGEWTHIVFVFKNSSATKLIYINGVEQTNKNGPNRTSTPAGIPDTVTVGTNLAGYISDYRVYATALSADDVKSLYQNCATIDPDGTIRGQIRS